MIKLKQSVARTLPVMMIDSTDHIAPKTGIAEGIVTVVTSKNGGALTGFTLTGLWTELGQGLYTIDFAIGDLNTVGFFAYLVTAAGCDQYSGVVYVDSFSDYKADVSALALEATAQNIKDKTDNLPVDPADQSQLEDAITATQVLINALPQDADIAATIATMLAGIVAAHTITDGKVDLNTAKLNTAQDGIDDLIAAALTEGTSLATLIKILTNKWEITGNQLIMYDDDGTALYTFDLTRDGVPSEFNPDARSPV